MARLLPQTLTLRRSQLSLTQVRRFRSTLSFNGRLTEVEISSEGGGGGDTEALVLKKLDDIVHRIIVQKATPDWLPFLPGSSFWVPPRRGSMKFGDLLGKLADHLSEEESLSLSSDRGWPCSRFFVDRGGFEQTSEVDESVEMESEGKEEVLTDSQDTHPSEDKEG